jgi:hypothetical protein
MWTTSPVSRELTLMTLGGVVSTITVTADVVVVLPALSVAVTVKLWLPSESAGVTKAQLRGT